MTCVSRALCNMMLFLRRVAVQTRDRQKGGVCYGPGSAAQHERARRPAQTAHAALRPGHTTDSLILGQDLTYQIASKRFDTPSGRRATSFLSTPMVPTPVCPLKVVIL